MNTENKIVNYFKGVRLEWGKITWPEIAQVKVETIFVILIVIAFTIIILFYDMIFSFILKFFK